MLKIIFLNQFNCSFPFSIVILNDVILSKGRALFTKERKQIVRMRFYRKLNRDTLNNCDNLSMLEPKEAIFSPNFCFLLNCE